MKAISELSGSLGVLADREFGGEKLFKWFNQKDIGFYIRIKENSMVRTGKKKLCKAEKLFCHIQSKTSQPFAMKIWLFDDNCIEYEGFL